MLYTSELSTSVFPEEFLDTLEHQCSTCGSDTMITETLTKLICPNIKCIDKLAIRLTALLADLGVKNMGESRCYKFFETYNVDSPYAIFALEPLEGQVAYKGASQEFSIALYESLNKVRTMTLWDYVKIGNLPGIRDHALELFSGYKTLEDFYEDFEDEETGGVFLISRLLSIKTDMDSDDYESLEGIDVDMLSVEEKEQLTNDGYSLRALKVARTLELYKDDLFEFIEYVNFKRNDLPVINITISTSVGEGFSSKKDFVNMLNNKYSDQAQINFLSSVSKKTDFLIWSYDGAPTSKVVKARKINLEHEKATGEKNKIPIMTGIEFDKYLEENINSF